MLARTGKRRNLLVGMCCMFGLGIMNAPSRGQAPLCTAPLPGGEIDFTEFGLGQQGSLVTEVWDTEDSVVRTVTFTIMPETKCPEIVEVESEVFDRATIAMSVGDRGISVAHAQTTSPLFLPDPLGWIRMDIDGPGVNFVVARIGTTVSYVTCPFPYDECLDTQPAALIYCYNSADQQVGVTSAAFFHEFGDMHPHDTMRLSAAGYFEGGYIAYCDIYMAQPGLVLSKMEFVFDRLSVNETPPPNGNGPGVYCEFAGSGVCGLILSSGSQ